MKRRKPTATVSRAPVPEEDDSSDDNDDGDNEIATQSIMVHSCRGYTTYAAYMFDVPPRKLKTDNLRKKLMIAEIQNSKAQKQFFQRGIEMMSVMKEFFRMYSLLNGFPRQPDGNDRGDHGYAMTEEGGENNSSNTNNDDSPGDAEI